MAVRFLGLSKISRLIFLLGDGPLGHPKVYINLV